MTREKMKRLAELVGEMLGLLLVAPPLILWSLNCLGLALPWTWRTWLAVAILASWVRTHREVRVRP